MPLSEVVYALALTKDHLREYIRAVGLVDSAVELYLEEELHLSIGHFFDKARSTTRSRVTRPRRPRARPDDPHGVT